MAKNIKQKILFSERAVKLYNFYMNEKLHTQTTGAKAKVSKEIGSTFTAGGGYIKGKILHLIPKRMIIQTWRGKDWEASKLDSILTLIFTDKEVGAEIEMIHANVPDEYADDIKKGWNEHYWKPWKKYIESSQKKTTKRTTKPRTTKPKPVKKARTRKRSTKTIVK